MQKTTNAIMEDLFAPPKKNKKDHHHRSERRVAPTAEEKPLPNGDIYAGALSGKSPHGRGKYLWSDGCMYEGEWRRGRPCGRGRFSWPSGATYEGHFKSGRMDGLGTFLGPDGDTYSGSWLSDRKHGYGIKRYANGDLYEGHWFRDLQNGRGRYVWASAGTEYVGDWSRGAISGYGVLVWADGKSRYEGYWDNGGPRGGGGENAAAATNLPRICIWELDGEAGDITCDIVDNVEASSVFHDSQHRYHHPQEQQQPPASPASAKPGLTVSKGHKKYDLTLNVQLGISYAVGKQAASMVEQLTSADFDPNEKFWTRFPPEGSKHTPPHHSLDFKWKDYCPVVFRHLRQVFAIDSADYMVAICGNDSLREFCSPGKSGSFFYLTQDDRFIIKTIKKSEVKVLIRMLPTYYHHVCQYKNSLVTKFFGVHCVKPVGGQKTRFVVMGNLFSSEYRIHKRYDLKGSSHGRTIDKHQEEIDETTTLKDLDLNFVFRLERSWFQELIWQIERDCEFLEAERIMDYSLLIGLHFRGDNSVDDTESHSESKRKDVCTRLANEKLQDLDWVLLGRGGPVIRLGANMPGRAERVCSSSKSKSMVLEHVNNTKNEGESGTSSSSNSTPTTPNFNTKNEGEIFDVILYFGIIDILQDYDITKKLEHAYKSLQVDPTSISAVDPKLYSKRFRDFIHTIFLQDTSSTDS